MLVVAVAMAVQAGWLGWGCWAGLCLSLLAVGRRGKEGRREDVIVSREHMGMYIWGSTYVCTYGQYGKDDLRYLRHLICLWRGEQRRGEAKLGEAKRKGKKQKPCRSRPASEAPTLSQTQPSPPSERGMQEGSTPSTPHEMLQPMPWAGAGEGQAGGGGEGEGGRCDLGIRYQHEVSAWDAVSDVGGVEAWRRVGCMEGSPRRRCDGVGDAVV